MPLTEEERKFRELDSLYYQYIWPIGMGIVGLRPLHYLDIRRRARIKKGERVLEIGAGALLYRLYSEQVGEGGLFVSLDIYQNIQAGSKKLTEKLSKDSLKFVTGDAFALPFKDESFDLVIASNFHVGAPFHEVQRVLKPGGRYLQSMAELVVAPLSDDSKEDFKNLGFINTKARGGAIGSIVPIFWNRVVEATKP